jgi:RiboL-PSP-HEPN
MRIRTATQLADLLDDDLAWRKKEIITFKLLIQNAHDQQALALRRAGVALLYAHWEGFVKRAGDAYVEFVANQRLTHKQAKANFLALSIKGQMHNAIETSRATIFNGVAEYFVERIDQTMKLLWRGAVQTKANLSAERFKEIVVTLGLDHTPFVTKERTVIDRLKDQRNSIAHGRYLEVDESEYERLHEEVLGLVEEYRRQIDVAATTKAYRRA